jgi:hypothetical protein
MDELNNSVTYISALICSATHGNILYDENRYITINLFFRPYKHEAKIQRESG